MRIIISGGGTGGHIYPAIAIADEFKKRNVEIDILFVGAQGRMEMDRVPKAGYKIEGLWISGIQRKRSLKNLVVPIKLIYSLIKAGRILRAFRPDLVIGVGGYASGPTLRVAAWLGIPTLIQEQNSYPGMTNRLLAKHVNKICVAYPKMNRFFPESKLVMTGNPVRDSLLNINTKLNEAKSFFEWGHKKTLLMIGGSLGARTLNQAAEEAYEMIRNRDDVLFIWQTGKLYFDQVKTHPVANLAHVKVQPFIDRMDLAYALADIVIARAGALTIAELSTVGKPSILVPSPHVAEDHQTKNAVALVERNAAIMIEDEEAKTKLFDEAFLLIDNEHRKLQLSENIRKTAVPNSTGLIVNEGMKLMDLK